MPSAPLRPCRKVGCNKLGTTPYCEEHSKKRKEAKVKKTRDYDKLRGTRTERGYDNRWLKASKQFIKGKVCVNCEKNGVYKMSECTDHKIPVSGPDDPLFWDKTNWNPLCKNCHSEKTAKEDGAFGNKKVI